MNPIVHHNVDPVLYKKAQQQKVMKSRIKQGEQQEAI